MTATPKPTSYLANYYKKPGVGGAPAVALIGTTSWVTSGSSGFAAGPPLKSS
jgi:hypothetical protein